MRKTTQKSLTYKRVVFNDGTLNLQHLLEELLILKLNQAQERLQHLSEDSKEFQLINRWTKKTDTLFCQFIYYEEGKSKTIIKLENNKQYFEVDADKPERNQAFTEDIFYFAVKENDLVCVQTKSLKSRDLEKYLIWLLNLRNKETETTFVLADRPEDRVVDKLKKDNVKSVSIGTPLHASVIDNSSETSISKSNYHLTGLSRKLLSSIIEEFRGINIDSTLDEANIELQLLLTYKRKTSDSGHKFLDDISTALRHVDSEDYEVVLDNGAKLSGHELKITKKVTVKFLKSGLVDETDLYDKMLIWLFKILGNEL